MKTIDSLQGIIASLKEKIQQGSKSTVKAGDTADLRELRKKLKRAQRRCNKWLKRAKAIDEATARAKNKASSGKAVSESTDKEKEPTKVETPENAAMNKEDVKPAAKEEPIPDGQVPETKGGGEPSIPGSETGDTDQAAKAVPIAAVEERSTGEDHASQSEGPQSGTASPDDSASTVDEKKAGDKD